LVVDVVKALLTDSAVALREDLVRSQQVVTLVGVFEHSGHLCLHRLIFSFFFGFDVVIIVFAANLIFFVLK